MPKIPTSRIARTAKFGGLVAGQGARWAGTRAANTFRGDEAADEKTAERSIATANQIVAQLGQMKGAAMKIGQVLSTIDFELVPEGEREAFKAKLAELRDQAPRIPWEQMRKVIESDHDASVDEIFASFDPEPIAAASIGQVYRATTLDGRDVAVKVQYPGVAEAVETDLRNANLLFPLIKRLAPGLDVKAVVGELKERIAEELDYEIEAQNQRKVARAFRGHPFIVIPGVDTRLSTRRVLVTDFVAGRSFEQVRQLPEEERDAFGETLFRFYWGLLRREGLASGDPHPGNVLLADDGRVCFLDFGLMRKVPMEYYELERQVGRAAFTNDAAAVKEGLAQTGYLPDPDAFDADALLAQIRDAGAWHLEPGVHRLSQEDLRRQMLESGSPHSEHFDLMRRQTVPAEALLIRRMEGLLFAVLCELGAAADWHQLVRESLGDSDPVTPLGLAEQDWLLGGLAA